MEDIMKRKGWAIGISVIAVVILVFGSLANVVGYQTVQVSQQNTIKERINQRELLFQTIVDIANNREIQGIILKSHMSRGIFPTSEFPVVTKNQIRQMYFLGLILSKVISKSRIQSIIGQYQFSNQEIQKEISTVIEKDATLNWDISQLKDSECDCENGNTFSWHFPIICGVLFLLVLPILGPALIFKAIIESLLDSNRILLANILFLFDIPFIIMCAVLIALVFTFECEI
jgi:hypothetical protein